METQEITSYESVATENDLNEDAFAAFCENQHVAPENCEGMVSEYREAFVGEFYDGGDFAQEHCTELHNLSLSAIPKSIFNAIDWDNVWESDLCYDFYEIDGFIFRNI